MLIHMVVFILLRVTVTNGNAGTAIFYRHTREQCWNDDELLKLRARKSFEELVPPQVKPVDVDDKYIKDLLRYYRKAIYSMDDANDPHTQSLLKEALFDTVGAHLRSDVLPAVRFAYYAGYVSYRKVRQLHDFYDEIKVYLNTQGIGWNKPIRASQDWSNMTVAKILIGAGTFFDPCSCLIIKRDSNSCIHLPIPKHDNSDNPSAIALPFRTSGLVSLTSPDSKNAFLKYYTTASRCILSSSPETCRHSDFITFNNELWHWMKRDVAPHLSDESLYATYGGILRVAASVQNYGKGLSRRNLFTYDKSDLGKWHPWKSFSQSYIYINADWTPKIYVGLVLLTAFTIYVLQICYTYICGDSSACQCRRPSRSFFSKDVDANIATLPKHRSTIFYSDKKRAKQSASKSKSASLNSMRAQKVYDLNENTEKLMAVIMSEGSEVESSPRQCSKDEKVFGLIKQSSPPKLETSISQVTVEKRRPQLPIYSTSSMTQTITGTSQRQDISCSSCSGTESSSSSRSYSSSTSKSRKSRSSRDLAWARRVISKHSRSITKTTSRTDLTANSCSTPTSHR